MTLIIIKETKASKKLELNPCNRFSTWVSFNLIILEIQTVPLNLNSDKYIRQLSQDSIQNMHFSLKFIERLTFNLLLSRHYVDYSIIQAHKMQTSNAAIKKIIGQLREAGSVTQTQQIAQSINNNLALDVLELAVAFDAYIIDHDDLIPLELKLNIMEAMSGALLLDKRGRFLKHFVTRIYFFFNKYSLTISEFPQLSSRVIELFRQWKSSEVFAEPFLKKLEKLANSIFLFNTEKPQHFKKYNQNFLMMLKDVQEVEVTNEIYEMLHIKTNALEEVKKISEEAGRFERFGESQQQRKERLKAMKRDVQNVIESLSHILQLNEQGMEHLKVLMLGEQLRLQENLR